MHIGPGSRLQTDLCMPDGPLASGFATHKDCYDFYIPKVRVVLDRPRRLDYSAVIKAQRVQAPSAHHPSHVVGKLSSRMQLLQ